MDAQLISLVNTLQDTFSNLGQWLFMLLASEQALTTLCLTGGELDMPQIVVVSKNATGYSSFGDCWRRLAVSRQGSQASSKRPLICCSSLICSLILNL